jgi:hypothetical protein
MDWYFYAVHQRYNRYISNAGGREGNFFESFHFAIHEPTSSPEPVLQPAKSRSLHLGTEHAPSLFQTERISYVGL